MVANAYFAFLGFMGVSFLACILGVAVTYIAQGEEIAYDLFRAWIFDFKGLLIGGTTWAMTYMVVKHGRGILGRMLELLDIDTDRSARLLISYLRAYSPVRIIGKGLPIGAAGEWILHRSGYPLVGFAKWFLS